MKILKDISVIGVALIAILYIINPGAGIIEIIPDNFPIIGNLDEAAAVFIIISALKYFGFELPDIFNKHKSTEKGKENTPIKIKP